MTDLVSDVDAPIAPARSNGAVVAWAAYADLLGLLRGTIHLEGPGDPVDAAMERLFAIAEAWVTAEDVLPFSRQSEIDLVSTLLALASYSSKGPEFARLSEAFAETVGSFARSPSRHGLNFVPMV